MSAAGRTGVRLFFFSRRHLSISHDAIHSERGERPQRLAETRQGRPQGNGELPAPSDVLQREGTAAAWHEVQDGSGDVQGGLSSP